MKPYGLGAKSRAHKNSIHGSWCAICCPITFKEARRRKLLDYNERMVSRAKEKRRARREIDAQLEARP